jgi:hypothetical protein
VPRSHRQAAVISPRSSRASHRQYLTIAHSAQQQVGVGRDPSPTTGSSPSITGQIRSNGPIVLIEHVARNGADAIEHAAGPYLYPVNDRHLGIPAVRRAQIAAIRRGLGERIRSTEVV